MLRLCLHTQTGIQYYPDEIKQLLINSGLYKLVYISGYNPQSIFFLPYLSQICHQKGF